MKKETREALFGCARELLNSNSRSKTITKHARTNKLTGTRKIYYSDVNFENSMGGMIKLIFSLILGGIAIMDAVTDPDNKDNNKNH